MNENINTYYKEKVKEYIPNILNGQNEEEIIKCIFDVDDETQITSEYTKTVRDEIGLYKKRIDDFFCEDKIEKAIINNDGNLILARSLRQSRLYKGKMKQYPKCWKRTYSVMICHSIWQKHRMYQICCKDLYFMQESCIR